MEKIYNFAKKDFFIFASTYVAIIFLVLLCFFPVCRAFERSEQNQAIAEIRDYASSMLGELDLQEQAIFNATRNLYSDRDFTSIYYNSTRSSSSSLFYDMGKNVQPMYEELIHIPFFIYDPRNPIQGERRNQLAQTIDIVPTLAEFFQIAPPEYMDGHSLTPVIRNDTPIRNYALFGIFGGHICITDGRYVYMRSCKDPENQPLYEYTAMPCHMDRPFSREEMSEAELCDKNAFNFMKESGVFKVPVHRSTDSYRFGTMLFDLLTDPEQKCPIHDSNIEDHLCQAMKKMMKDNQAPKEQFERIGLTE